MAKFNGGVFSKAKGKLAGIVFQQYEGLQVGKEYQPNVKNPSTANQVAARAKFKAASQLVATFSDVFMISISSLSRYSRTLRGSLVRVLTRTFTWDDTNDTATISADQVAAAVNGLVYNTPIPAPVITGSNISNSTITATVGDTVRYQISAFDRDGHIIGSADETFVATSTPESITAPVVIGTPFGYTIAAVAMRAVTNEGNAIYGNLYNATTLEVMYGVSEGDLQSSHVAYADIAQA